MVKEEEIGNRTERNERGRKHGDEIVRENKKKIIVGISYQVGVLWQLARCPRIQKEPETINLTVTFNEEGENEESGAEM